MPEQISDGLDMHARLEPGYGGTVPQRVHTDVFDACLIGGNLDGPQHVARVHRAAELGGEHQAAIGPLVAGMEPLDGWAARCALSTDTMTGERGTVRRDRGDFGSVIISSVPMRPSVAATFSAPLVRSTRSQPRRQRFTAAQPGSCNEHQHQTSQQSPQRR